MEKYIERAHEVYRILKKDLTSRQNKILNYCVEKVQPGDTPTTEYEISISGICNACGIAIDDEGQFIETLEDELGVLARPTWLELKHSDEMIRAFYDLWINPITDRLGFTFHEQFMHYLQFGKFQEEC